MWKYIEGCSSEDAAREHFGIKEPGCPIVKLANGKLAVWTAAPLTKTSDYPPLSGKPASEAQAEAFASVPSA